jgi:CheY-like chemotaxis protein
MFQEKVSDKPYIVIVDDNEIDLMIANRLFNRVDSDICVQTFMSCQELSIWLESKKEDGLPQNLVFLIDIYMPNCNGFSIAESISHFFDNHPLKPPCYLLSASIDYSDKLKIKQNEFVTGFLGKPITIDWISMLLNKV